MLDNIAEIFDYTLIHATIRSSTPILFAALAAIITQQADILNIGVEGIMLSGAFVAVAVSFYTGSWLFAVIAAILVGVIISAIIGIAHLKYKADVFAVGTIINMLALALTRFFLNSILGVSGSFYSKEIVAIPKVNIPFIENSEFLNSIFNNYSLFEIVGIIMVFVLWYVLYKTVWGLRIRSVGLNSMAAETAGLNVFKNKFRVILISGVFGGIAGAHLSLGYSNLFVENMTNGRGFMGVAAMFFGGANPIFAWIGSLIFGLADSVGSRLQAYGLPSQFILMIPYVATIAILAISMASKIKRDKKMKSTIKS
ncbi:ABC transporter permease [Senegalia massiliensis]|uniref:ABC transporter permease n=1 Tax=Senegalia massiliensis TaxID=1720316 RepID=A0A845R100_9CLOT|nr:ABC transporter permease [Senegalia massiliensis]NBI07112.1 ABC transporter permease [Senegalia massiliensis]